MFSKLRNRIIIITMAITTTVLIIAGVFIMLFSSAMRPEPKPYIEMVSLEFTDPNFNDQQIQAYIKSDRQEGNIRLLITLLCVGAAIEIAVFLISYYLSQKIVEPVQDAYDKQKLFIANASHELKTPLAVIQANMEALEVDKDNEKWKNNIETEITHANKLVLDLLQLAKMDAGSFDKTPPEEVNLATEIENRISIFQPKFSGQITFKSSTTSSTHLLPKRDLLQVLDILLDNATKYARQKINIALDNHNITISNDGTTIPQDDLAKIFDRFYQTDKTKEGSGLGLAIARAICEQNSWQISCNSNKRTTKFTISFGNHH